MLHKITPVIKNYIWGGMKLHDRYAKVGEGTPFAESWELSFHKDGKSLIGGKPIDEAIPYEDFGTNVSSFDHFPALVKFIDAKENLSVQVHPSDALALTSENSYGKTEMWYIVEADAGAGIYLGFREDVSEDTVRRAIEQNTLCELLNFYPVTAGECYFIPAGTVHAIGKGCLIAEVQQNSNITYRLFDYGRVGADGNPRELHVEKGIQAANLNKFENNSLRIDTEIGAVLGVSKYFTTTKLTLNGDKTIPMDRGTFRLFLSVGAEGEIGGEPLKAGDAYLATAEDTEVTLSAHGDLLLIEVRRYTVGIDLGGTFIKGGIVDDLGRILLSDSVPTESEKGADGVADNIARLVNSLLMRTGLSADDVLGIGMGVPGMINSKDGVVTYSNNLAWQDFAIAKGVEARTGARVKIANDANVAALGEAKFGAGRGLNSLVMLTLGTGVGGGAVLDGRLYEGNLGAGAEFGHSAIVLGDKGRLCTCGRRGCLEAYASASALIRDTKRSMLRNRESKMWQVGSLDRVDGRTAFAYRESDSTAAVVVARYIEALGCGITNIANVLRPDAILIGGGVSAQGDNLIKPLNEYLEKHLFGGKLGPAVPILTATLGNRAGIVGAAALFMQ